MYLSKRAHGMIVWFALGAGLVTGCGDDAASIECSDNGQPLSSSCEKGGEPSGETPEPPVEDVVGFACGDYASDECIFEVSCTLEPCEETLNLDILEAGRGQIGDPSAIHQFWILNPEWRAIEVTLSWAEDADLDLVLTGVDGTVIARAQDGVRAQDGTTSETIVHNVQGFDIPVARVTAPRGESPYELIVRAREPDSEQPCSSPDQTEEYTPPACDRIVPEAARLFSNVHAVGASNTPSRCAASSCALEELTGEEVYYTHVVKQAWKRLAPCVDYTPHISNVAVDAVAADTTLSLSVDAFFWWAVDQGDDSFVSDYVDTLAARAPQATYFVSNVPNGLVDATASNEEIAAAVAQRSDHHLVDLDETYRLAGEGRLLYNGIAVDLRNVTSDGLHLTAYGSCIVADVFIADINRRFPSLEIPPIGELEVVRP